MKRSMASLRHILLLHENIKMRVNNGLLLRTRDQYEARWSLENDFIRGSEDLCRNRKRFIHLYAL